MSVGVFTDSTVRNNRNQCAQLLLHLTGLACVQRISSQSSTRSSAAILPRCCEPEGHGRCEKGHANHGARLCGSEGIRRGLRTTRRVLTALCLGQPCVWPGGDGLDNAGDVGVFTDRLCSVCGVPRPRQNKLSMRFDLSFTWHSLAT